VATTDTFRLNNQAGTYTVSVTATGNGGTASLVGGFSVTNNAGAVAKVTASPTTLSGTVDQNLAQGAGNAFVVSVFDKYNNPVPNASVTFSAPGYTSTFGTTNPPPDGTASGRFLSGSGTRSAQTGFTELTIDNVPSDATGTATTDTFRLNNQAGTFTVGVTATGNGGTASLPGGFSVTNNADVAAKLVYVTPADEPQNTTIAYGAIVLTLTAYDKYNNLATTYAGTVTLAIDTPLSNGTGTLSANNVKVASGGVVSWTTADLLTIGASLADVGDYVLDATGTSITGTFPSTAFNVGPATQTPDWKNKSVPTLPGPTNDIRAFASAATGLGAIYATGGTSTFGLVSPTGPFDVQNFDPTAFTPLNLITKYLSATDAWSVPAITLSSARAGLSTVEASNLLFAIGGMTAGPGFSSTIDVIDPRGPSVSTLSTGLTSARAFHTAALGGDGQIYIFGGVSALAGSPVSSIEVLKPGTNGSTPVTLTGTSVYTPAVLGAAAQAPNGKIYLFGGYSGYDVSNNPIPVLAVQVFDPSGPSMAQLSVTLPSALFGAAAITGADGRIYVCGGSTPTGPTSTVMAFDVTRNEFEAVQSLAAGSLVGLTGAQAADGRVVTAYGLAGGNTVGTTEAYGPDFLTLSATSADAGQTVTISGTNFALSAALVTIYWGDSKTGLPFQTTATSNAGAFSGVSLTIPATAADKITVVDNRSGYPVSVPFTVAHTDAPPSWLQTQQEQTALSDNAAAVGADGRVYVFGGIQAGPLVSTETEVFDPVNGGWTDLSATAPLPGLGRTLLAGVADGNGLIYAIGGDTTGGGAVQNEVDQFNTGTQTWTQLTGVNQSMPTSRSGLGAALAVNGNIYAIGGQDASGNPLGVVEVLTPGNGANPTWSTGFAPMPTARTRLAVVGAPNGLVYAIGGEVFNAVLTADSPVATVEAYNPATDTWQSVSQLPIGTNGLTQATATVGLDGRIYVFGGLIGLSSSPVSAASVSGSVYVYSPALDSWQTLAASLATPVSGLASATTPDGRLLALGGVDSGGGRAGDTQAFGPEGHENGGGAHHGPIILSSTTINHTSEPTTVTATGTNFGAGAKVYVYIITASPLGTIGKISDAIAVGSTIAGGTLKDSSGLNPLSVPIAGVGAGNYFVVFVDSTSDFPVMTPLRIN
jgi:N-acetylneuraminic acid mutarotase